VFVLLVLTAGWTNFGYVLAILDGEVMRVLLLFYLAPVWTILFSYWLLGERLNGYGYTIIFLSFTGAMVMLWEPHLGMPLPNNTAEWIGLSAGMGFALSNVVARRCAHLSVETKSFGVWVGTSLLSLLYLFLAGRACGQCGSIDADSWGLLALLGIVLCSSAFAVQVRHLPCAGEPCDRPVPVRVGGRRGRLLFSRRRGDAGARVDRRRADCLRQPAVRRLHPAEEKA